VIRREGVMIALRGIAANRLRSALTVLGITIGVAAVIVLVAVGRGSAVDVQNRIASLGTNVLTVMPGGGFGFSRGGGATRTGTASSFQQLTDKDVKALQDKTVAPSIKSVSPIVTATVTATFDGATHDVGQFFGSTPSIAEARNYEIASGRFFTDDEVTAHERVVVIGQTVATNLFGGQDPLDQTIKLNGASYRVIGVLKSKGTNGIQDQDDVAVAPITAVRDTAAGGSSISQIVVQATSSGTVDSAQSEIETVLTSTHSSTVSTGTSSSSSSSFRILNQASLLQTTNDTNHTFTVLLGAVAAISLLVGGIGVMNIMLVSVTERTREIGIRKAIGAQRSDIVGQFIAEAVLLSMLGGLVGVIVGILVSRLKIVGVQPVVQPYSVLLAFGVAVAVGLFFGIYPANRAASLRPIEALRYE
jgi:putative ABC transport system permease protein